MRATVVRNYGKDFEVSTSRIFSYVADGGVRSARVELFTPVNGSMRSYLAYGKANEKLVVLISVVSLALFIAALGGYFIVNFPDLMSLESLFSTSSMVFGVLLLLSLCGFAVFAVCYYFMYRHGKRKAWVIPLEVSSDSEPEHVALLEDLLSFNKSGVYSREKHEEFVGRASKLEAACYRKSSALHPLSVYDFVDSFPLFLG